MYKRNGFQTRKITHENAVSPVDAKSSLSWAHRALIRLVVDFARIKEMASRCEKVRTRKPFLSETRSPPSIKPSGRLSNHRSTSRILTECLIDAKNYARKRHSSQRREVFIPSGAARPPQFICRLRVYKRNGLQTRKITHENAVSPVGAKSSTSSNHEISIKKPFILNNAITTNAADELKLLCLFEISI